MLTDNQKKWVDALRSGEYKQGRSALHRGKEFCCLGVACDLAVKEGVIPEPQKDGVHALYGKEASSAFLPREVREWFGVRMYNGQFKNGSLIALNDDGRSFSEIADIIESGPEGLFVKDTR